MLLDLYHHIVGNLRYWDGSVWKAGTMHRWNGNQWLSAPHIQRWNGTTWT